jgi:hypothetical protein
MHSTCQIEFGDASQAESVRCPSPRLLSALTAEPKFAVTVVWFVARNHSAIIATTTMSQIIACESLLNLSTQHRDVGRLHRWLSMNAAAIQKGHTDERAAGFRDMGTFRCDQCGESSLFTIPCQRICGLQSAKCTGSKKFLPKAKTCREESCSQLQ